MYPSKRDNLYSQKQVTDILASQLYHSTQTDKISANLVPPGKENLKNVVSNAGISMSSPEFLVPKKERTNLFKLKRSNDDVEETGQDVITDEGMFLFSLP